MAAFGDEGASAGLAPRGLQAITVGVAGQFFALDILSVREIRGWIPPSPLPHAPAYVKGMIDLRGSLIPVVSLADRLGIDVPDANASSVIAVTTTASGAVGLVVDSVSDIITVADEMVQPPPQIGGNAAQIMVKGILMREGQIISILSVEGVLPASLLQTSAVAA